MTSQGLRQTRHRRRVVALLVAALGGAAICPASAQIRTQPIPGNGPIDGTKLTLAQFEALPPGARINVKGQIITKGEIAARQADARQAASGWHTQESAQDKAELAADQARLNAEKQARLTAAQAKLRPQIETLARTSPIAGSGQRSPAELVRARAAVLLLQSRDPSHAAAAELEAKRLFLQSKGVAR